MPDEVSTGLGEFFDQFWQQTPGYVYLATLDRGENFKQYMVEWPKHKGKIVQHVLAENSAGRDVFFSPSLFKERTAPVKENVKGSHVLWADFDNGSAPADWSVTAKERGIPEPTLIVQSSVEGNQHVYWHLGGLESDVERIENRNRAIAYRLGADTSGWDADQLLRPPFTTNHGYKSGGERKPWYEGASVPVKIVGLPTDTRRVSIDQFESLGTPEREYLDNLRLGELPSLNEVLALAKWTKEFLAAFNMTKDEAAASSPGKRSAALQRLAYMGAEHGFTDEQIYVIVDDADRRWEKYTERSKAGREKILRDTIARARAKVGNASTEELTFAGLLQQNSAVEPSDVKLVYNFQEFLDAEIHIEWLFKGLIAQDGIGIITGEPGVGKTQFGIQLAIALALGSEEFLIWKNESTPKKVLFFSLEMSHAPLSEFMETIAPAYGDHRTLARNMHIAPIGEAIPLNLPAGQAFLDSLLTQHKPDVLFIDSLQMMTSAALTDELAAKELMGYLKKVRAKHHCAIFFVHHNRKKGNDGSHAGSLSDMYGSQFIAADVDFVVPLRKLGDTHIIAVDCWKQRLAQSWRSFEVERNEHIQYDLYTGGMGVDDFNSGAAIINPSRKPDDGVGEGRDIFSV